MTTILRTAHRIARRVCHCRSLAADSRGVALVELAAALPVLLLLGIGVYDVGTLLLEGIRLESAAKAGVQPVLYDPASIGNVAAAKVSMKQAAIEEWVGHSVPPEEIDTLPIVVTPSAYCACVGGAEITCTDTCAGGGAPGRYVAISTTRTVTLNVPKLWTDQGAFSLTRATTARVQ